MNYEGPTIQLPPEQPKAPVTYRRIPNHKTPRNMKPRNPRELPPEVVEKMRPNKLISRNSKCPCGSSLRYKRCCGKETI